MNYIEVKLPIPPSVNSAYAGMQKRHKSKAYKEWYNKAMREYKFCNENDIIKGDKWLEVEYCFRFPINNKNGSKKVKDVFNYEKLTSDFLAQIIPGFEDHKIKKGTVIKMNSEKENIVHCIIKEL